jgi:hypothetical protein
VKRPLPIVDIATPMEIMNHSVSGQPRQITTIKIEGRKAFHVNGLDASPDTLKIPDFNSKLLLKEVVSVRQKRDKHQRLSFTFRAKMVPCKNSSMFTGDLKRMGRDEVDQKQIQCILSLHFLIYSIDW